MKWRRDLAAMATGALIGAVLVLGALAGMIAIADHLGEPAASQSAYP